jgi:cellobiose phosphorylase
VVDRNKTWWTFNNTKQAMPADGTFQASGFMDVGRLYFPICNEGGMRSSVTPALQGSPARGQNSFLGLPLSAEDLPHMLAHRGCWVVPKGKKPVALTSLSPQGLKAHVRHAPKSPWTIDAGPGWFQLTRKISGFGKICATLWCPADLDEAVEYMRITIVNTTGREQRYNLYAAVPVFARSADNLRDHRHVTALFHRARLLKQGVEVCPEMSFDERGHQLNNTRYLVLAAGANGGKPDAVWVSQREFLGDNGSFACPEAVWQGRTTASRRDIDCNGREAVGGFLFRNQRLKPGGRLQYTLLSGITESPRAAGQWTRMIKSAQRVDTSLQKTRDFWQRQIGQIRFSTPDDQLNNWLVWVGFQPFLRRIYGNSFLPEFDYGRGGKGWRDLWQDCLALLLYDPCSVRNMLLQYFAGVRIDGSNATIIGNDGGFKADRNDIPRTWMDHGIWPTHTTLLYIDQTGDLDFLFEKQSYFRDPQVFRCRSYGNRLKTRKGAIYRASLLEHMIVQNVTAFYNVGEHNLCRTEGADWNDGMDMAADRGESVAFSAFYAWNLQRLADLLDDLNRRGVHSIALARELDLLLDRLPGNRRIAYGIRAKQQRLDTYLRQVAGDPEGKVREVSTRDLARDLRAKSRDIRQRIRKREWVQLSKREACFNGYYDNRGRRVAGPHPKGARMTLSGQVFPLMAGVATPEQVEQIMRTVQQRLLDPVHGGIRLNTDFREPQPDLGRAFSFYYGEKENGAVFSHMAVMYAFALYSQRQARAARKVWHALYEKAMQQDIARIFPCLPEYFNAHGRGMYCYLTGSASWMVYLLHTTVYGVRGRRGDLVLDPQLCKADFDRRGRTAVNTCFAGRDLTVQYINRKRLDPQQYRILHITCDGEDLPFSQGKHGGALIGRDTLSACPARKPVTLKVTLAQQDKDAESPSQ